MSHLLLILILKYNYQKKRFGIQDSHYKGFNMFRLLLITVVLLLSGCILIPLPDGGPDVQQTALPKLGARTEQIHQNLGTPNLLNSTNYKIYDWETGRRFLIIPAFPTGLPVGGVIAKNRTRLLLALDEQGAVARMECSVAALDSEQLKTLGCLDPTKQHSETTQLYEQNEPLAKVDSVFRI